MLRFLFRRLLIAIPTLFVVVTLAFFMMRAAKQVATTWIEAAR